MAIRRNQSERSGTGTRGGFTLIELLVVIGIIALLIGILLPALGGARDSARTMLCQANMRQMGAAAINYGTSYRDTIPAFNWKPGNYRTPYGDLRNPENDTDSVRFQAIHILREWTGNRYIPLSTGPSDNWFANLWFSHLVYKDFLSGNLEEPVAACPEDVEQVERAERPIQDWDTWELYRKFESSYETSIATYSEDIPRSDEMVVQQHRWHYNLFDRGDHFLKSRRFAAVAFPSSKVYMFDSFDRHFAEKPATLFFEPGTRQPVLMFDGSVAARNTEDAGPGFQPKNPSDPGPTLIYKGNAGSEHFPGYFRWTRGGLRGIDFGGSEISTGQPRQP